MHDKADLLGALAHDLDEDARGRDDPLMIAGSIGEEALDEREQRAGSAQQRSAGILESYHLRPLTHFRNEL
jgi:hypothetical protein